VVVVVENFGSPEVGWLLHLTNLSFGAKIIKLLFVFSI
jgi:hypothetical protein